MKIRSLIATSWSLELRGFRRSSHGTKVKSPTGLENRATKLRTITLKFTHGPRFSSSLWRIPWLQGGPWLAVARPRRGSKPLSRPRGYPSSYHDLEVMVAGVSRLLGGPWLVPRSSITHPPLLPSHVYKQTMDAEEFKTHSKIFNKTSSILLQ